MILQFGGESLEGAIPSPEDGENHEDEKPPDGYKLIEHRYREAEDGVKRLEDLLMGTKNFKNTLMQSIENDMNERIAKAIQEESGQNKQWISGHKIAARAGDSTEVGRTYEYRTIPNTGIILGRPGKFISSSYENWQSWEWKGQKPSEKISITHEPTAKVFDALLKLFDANRGYQFKWGDGNPYTISTNYDGLYRLEKSGDQETSSSIIFTDIHMLPQKIEEIKHGLGNGKSGTEERPADITTEEDLRIADNETKKSGRRLYGGNYELTYGVTLMGYPDYLEYGGGITHTDPGDGRIIIGGPNDSSDKSYAKTLRRTKGILDGSIKPGDKTPDEKSGSYPTEKYRGHAVEEVASPKRTLPDLSAASLPTASGKADGRIDRLPPSPKKELPISNNEQEEPWSERRLKIVRSIPADFLMEWSATGEGRKRDLMSTKDVMSIAKMYEGHLDYTTRQGYNSPDAKNRIQEPCEKLRALYELALHRDAMDRRAVREETLSTAEREFMNLRLAELYRDGNGGKADIKQAIEFYSAAADMHGDREDDALTQIISLYNEDGELIGGNTLVATLRRREIQKRLDALSY